MNITVICHVSFNINYVFIFVIGDFDIAVLGKLNTTKNYYKSNKL